jgi:polyisoprenoid-binding protein YceI
LSNKKLKKMKSEAVITETKWTLDPTHSELIFKVKHLMISTVTGRFRKFDLAVETDEEDFTKIVSAKLVADLHSIDTNNEQRDNHLRSNDFFNADKFKQLVFEVTRYEGDSSEGKLYGDLTIRDVTKSIVLEMEAGGIVTDSYGQTKAGFTVNGKINRKEFGLIWNGITEAGGVIVGDEVKIHAEIQLLKQL